MKVFLSSVSISTTLAQFHFSPWLYKETPKYHSHATRGRKRWQGITPKYLGWDLYTTFVLHFFFPFHEWPSQTGRSWNEKVEFGWKKVPVVLVLLLENKFSCQWRGALTSAWIPLSYRAGLLNLSAIEVLLCCEGLSFIASLASTYQMPVVLSFSLPQL